jgi:hypothetical protein
MPARNNNTTGIGMPGIIFTHKFINENHSVAANICFTQQS